MEENVYSPEELAERLQDIVAKLKAMGRSDLILRSIGGSTLEELKLETAKRTLSRLVITSDFRFMLPDFGNVEVDLQPVHKAVYLLFPSSYQSFGQCHQREMLAHKACFHGGDGRVSCLLLHHQRSLYIQRQRLKQDVV